MKTRIKYYILLSLSLIGSIVFHNQNTGINYTLYTIVIIAISLFADKHKTTKHIIIKTIPALLCSIMLCIQPQTITFILWLFSILTIWVNTWYQSQPLLIPIEGLLSIITSPFIHFRNKKHLQPTEIKINDGLLKKITPYVISAIIVGCFGILYSSANPIVSNAIEYIDLGFIKFDFFKTFLLILSLNFGLIFFKVNKKFIHLNNLPTILKPSPINEKDHQEFRIAKMSLGIISVCLFFVNLSDFFVMITGKLPKNISYSEYVHQGFYTLILSLSLAIALLIYFFRNRLNFHEKFNQLKTVSFLWISQNIVLAAITGCKNYMYVEVYGLTYNRIAVFTGLILTIIGLIFLVQKINKSYTNWNFYNLATVPSFAFLICLSLLPIDKLITKYNLTTSQTKDYSYLLYLLNHPDYKAVIKDMELSGYEDANLSNYAKRGIEDLQEQQADNSWLSWNYYTHQQTN